MKNTNSIVNIKDIKGIIFSKLFALQKSLINKFQFNFWFVRIKKTIFHFLIFCSKTEQNISNKIKYYFIGFY